MLICNDEDCIFPISPTKQRGQGCPSGWSSTGKAFKPLLSDVGFGNVRHAGQCVGLQSAAFSCRTSDCEKPDWPGQGLTFMKSENFHPVAISSEH